MNTQLVNMLHLTWEPVGVFFGNTTAACEFTPSPDKRNCVLPLLMSASRGKIIGRRAAPVRAVRSGSASGMAIPEETRTSTGCFPRAWGRMCRRGYRRRPKK